MSSKIYEFNKCNDIGKKGEFLIAELFPSIFTLTDGMEGDLIFKKEYRFELKTDTYQSGNFFFERISNMRLNNNGGVWQTKEHGCKYYSYYMLKYDMLYIFETDTILEWLNKNIHKYNSKIVKNKTKKSLGYTVPIKDLANIWVKSIDLTLVNNYFTIKNKYKL